MSAAPPLRFLTLVLGGWIALRASLLAADWWLDRGGVSDAPDASLAARAAAPPSPAVPFAAAPAGTVPAVTSPGLSMVVRPTVAAQAGPAATFLPASPVLARPQAATAPAAPVAAVGPPGLARPPTPLGPPRRWHGSAWAFVRGGGNAALTPGGTLGGSQIGGRVTYRLNGSATRPLALSGRAYAPLGDIAAGDVGVGIDWRPLAGVPLNVLAERRQAAGRRGRSAFALTVYGGVSERPVGRLRLDAYGQAGVVGMRARDPFVDGAAILAVPAGRARLGAGLWGAAQPGAARVDAGPRAAWRLPGTAVVAAADWRFRIAGDAAPGSGPALTLSTDF